MPEEAKPFVKGAFILAGAALFMKILSAVYRVPFQNIVGDTGFYIYQQVYPLYGIAFVLATTGFPVIISRIVAGEDYQGDGRAGRNIRAAFIVLLLAGLVLFLFCFFGGRMIALWMGDPKLDRVIRVIAFIFLLLPFLSVWRGIFQGRGNMVPTALSQVLEQLIRVGAILMISFILVHKGFSLYDVGVGAWAGAVAGSAAGAILLFLFAAKNNRNTKITTSNLSFHELAATGKWILVEGMAVCFSGLLLISFQLIDSINVYSLLVRSGVESMDAKVLKGVFDRGQPLVQLGTTAASSISLALVPALAAAWSQGNKELLEKKTEMAVKATAALGAGAAVGLINIIEPTNTMLFKNEDGSAELAVLSAAIFTASMVMIFSGVFQGMGAALVPAKYLFAGLVCKYAFNMWLIPPFGTMGAAISTNIGLVAIFFLLLKELKKHLPVHTVLLRTLPRLLIASAAMTAVLQAWLFLFGSLGLEGRMWSAVSALGGVFLGGMVYAAVLLYSNLFHHEELKHVPLYAKVAAFRSGTKERRRSS